MRLNAVIMLATLWLQTSAMGNEVADYMRGMRNLASVDLLRLGQYYAEHSQPDSALICFSTVAARYDGVKGDQEGVRNRVIALSNIGSLYMTSYFDYRKSLAYILEAKDLAEHNGLTAHLSFIYINIAFVTYYDNLSPGNMPPNVVQYFQKAFDYAYEAKIWRALTVALSNLIEASVETGDTGCVSERLELFRQAEMPLDTELHDFVALECDAIEAYIQGNYATATNNFEQAASATINTQCQISALSCASEIYTTLAQWSKAEAVVRTALSIADPIAALPLYHKLSRIYKLQGYHTGERECNYRYFMLKDSLIGIYKIGNTRDAQFEHDITKANEEIRSLNEKHNSQRRLLVVSLAVLCVVALLLIGLLLAYRNIRQSYHALYQSSLDMLEREKLLKQHKEVTRVPDLQPQKYQQSRMTDEDTKALYSHIVGVLESSREIYDVGFTIERLSALAGARTRYVSQAINVESGTNFNALINRYRIMEACRMLNDRTAYGDYTIEAIAESVGFKSRSGFGVVFKSITGLTPSVYQSMARKNAN